MKFQDIPGQDDLKTAMLQAISRNKLAHAQLYAGNEGGAALPLVLAYVSYMFCDSRTETDSCGTCSSCVRIQKGIHPDFHFFFPKITVKDSESDKMLAEFMKSFRLFIQEKPFGLINDFTQLAGFESKNILISKDDSRRLIRTVSMKSVEGGPKVILIWLPEFFNSTAANAILKVLEEPPANTTYLMVTHSYHSLLATITSRALLFNVPPLSDEEIATWLDAKGMDADKTARLAKLAHGSIGQAMQVSTETEGLAYQEFQQWMRECLNNQFGELITRAEKFGQSDKLAQRSNLEFALDILREALVSGEPKLNNRVGQEAEFMRKFNNFLTLDRKQALYQELNEALINLDRNANAKMVNFHLSTTFAKLLVR
jgi:DNA polymerase-3 subunit delta'